MNRKNRTKEKVWQRTPPPTLLVRVPPWEDQCNFFLFVSVSLKADGPQRARFPVSPTATLPSYLWSLSLRQIFPSLPGSRLRFFIAMQVQLSCTASTNHKWLNLYTHVLACFPPQKPKRKESIVSRIELTNPHYFIQIARLLSTTRFCLCSLLVPFSCLAPRQPIIIVESIYSRSRMLSATEDEKKRKHPVKNRTHESALFHTNCEVIIHYTTACTLLRRVHAIHQ